MNRDRQLSAPVFAPALGLLDQMQLDRRLAAPLHSQIEAALRQMIEQHFADGDVFFKELEIVERLGVSRPTVRQALGMLTQKGLIDRRPFVGTVVTKPTPAKAPIKAAHVGIIVPKFYTYSEMISMYLQEFTDESRRRSLIPHAYQVPEDEAIDILRGHALRSPAEERCVFWHSETILSHLREAGYRTVTLHPPSRDYTGQAVGTDARMAAQIGVDYLRSLGHEKITLLVSEPARDESVQDKIEQFRAALPGGEVVLCDTIGVHGSYNLAHAHMSQVWKRRPTAVMTVSDPGAWAVLHWLARQGVSVPEQVSVLGFEDAPSSQFQHPALSTIAHPISAIAKTALELLWSEDDAPQRRSLPPDLIIRDSTGPARGPSGA